MIAAYLEQTGVVLPPALVTSAMAVLSARCAQADIGTAETLYHYPVPKLGEGGSCSLHDELDDTPYDVAPWLGGRNAASLATLQQLDALVQAAQSMVAADWLGVYCRFAPPQGARLVKLAYRGLPSRAEFPLTEAFATFSNNSRVGLSGRGVVIADVAAWQQAGGAYYQCDPKVQSEVCLPVLAADGSVLGILDAEAVRPGFFDAERQAALVALALALVPVFASQVPQGEKNRA